MLIRGPPLREDPINTLDTIAELQPGKNAQITAKKISESYKKMREAKKCKKMFKLPGEIVPSAPVVTPQADVVIPAPVVTSKVSARWAADKIRQKYKNVRKNKALKLLRLRGNERVLNDDTDKNETVFTKSARIAAKKISDKYKKIRNKKNVNLVKEIQEVASKKSAQIAAKKISDKYKKPSLPKDIADAETVIYTDDRNMEDASSNRGATIAANKIKNKYKKMRAKNNSLPFDLDEIEQAETKNYVDDLDILDVNLIRNAAIMARKISEKYKKIRRKRKRTISIELPIEKEPKRPKTNNSKKISYHGC